ncbi:hypothetical protein ACGFJC_29750 [Nonomuraea fuscirosea]|uniref:DUF4351 domain-containing protein n=1 Tax=Nonomuraea maheshkhaliensis TaxID=419590 RepID=A0ABP4TIW4_9ACTN
MTYPYQGAYAESLLAEGRAEGRAESRALGMAEALLKFLDIQGIAVPEEARERVLGCRDEAVLDDWLGRSVTAKSVEDVFG